MVTRFFSALCNSEAHVKSYFCTMQHQTPPKAEHMAQTEIQFVLLGNKNLNEKGLLWSRLPAIPVVLSVYRKKLVSKERRINMLLRVNCTQEAT